jgi:hypothetical protein
LLLVLSACGSDGAAERDVGGGAEASGQPPCADAVVAVCAADTWRCADTVLQWCRDGGAWEVIDDCAAGGASCQAAGTAEGFACVVDQSCSGNVTRCLGVKLLQACIEGVWQEVESCPARCEVADGLGRCVLPEPCLRGGQQRCRGTVVEECVDNWWTDALDCAVDGKVCEPILDLTQVVRCAEPTLGAELDTCSAVVAGTCEAGLSCIAPDGGTVERCFAGCDPGGAATCGADRVCAAAASATQGGVCFDATGVRDGPCGEDDAVVCGADGGQCTRTQSDPDTYRCKLRCDSVDIGESGGCPGGELCLASRFFFSQSPEVRCAYRGEPGVCDEAPSA